ncbi:hypothetical protein KM043_007702 [Ampulex compressa]|nr:hypothetical protein KM043_007702 [Ampulex compressa]
MSLRSEEEEKTVDIEEESDGGEGRDPGEEVLFIVGGIDEALPECGRNCEPLSFYVLILVDLQNSSANSWPKKVRTTLGAQSRPDWRLVAILFLFSELLRAKEFELPHGYPRTTNLRIVLQNYEGESGFLGTSKHVCHCGKRYTQKGSLDRHIRYECGKMPNLPCPQCGKMFKHRHHMTQHVRYYCPFKKIG